MTFNFVKGIKISVICIYSIFYPTKTTKMKQSYHSISRSSKDM